MLLRASLRQARRAPVRMAACFVLTALVCAFLTAGLNLRASTKRNMEAIYGSYEVIAVPSFEAYVNHRGELVEQGDHAGYWPCEAVDYDLTPILSATGVIGADIRSRFGAFVGGEDFVRGYVTKEMDFLRHGFYDVIRFVYLGEEPATLPNDDNDTSFHGPLKVTWSASGYPSSTYPKRLSLSANNWGESTPITLEPGKEYIASVRASAFHHGPAWEGWGVRTKPYAPIAEYTEDFWQTEQGQAFSDAANACYINLRSVNAVTTVDLSAILPFYNGSVSISEGRAFSREEYDSGARVCLVSRYLAGLNGWQVGDRIDLSFFPSDYLFSNKTTDLTSLYTKTAGDFFDEGSYEIVGFYDGRVPGGLADGDTPNFRRDTGVVWLDMFLPEKSVENAPAPRLSQYSVTIRLDPLSGQRFWAEMADSGLMDPQPGGYQLGLTLYDQGLSAMTAGLAQLDFISTLTVALSAAASLLAVTVLAAFHVWRSKTEIATLRSLGVRRGQVLIVALAGLMLACCLGCAVGAIVGHQVSQRVTSGILAAAEEDKGDITFTANTAKRDDLSSREDFQFDEGRQPMAAVFSACAVTLIMLAFCIPLTDRESRKPPLLQLGTKE